MSYYEKARSSRAVRLQELDYTGSGTQVTTTLGSQTYQVFIISDCRGYVSFGSTTITTSSRGTGATIEVMPNVAGSYWTTTPGQVLAFSSSSTSSGSCLITELS
jgi:hypothetical protein